MVTQGDAGTIWPYYQLIISQITEGSRIVNLGSGHHFVFESNLQNSKSSVEIHSIDKGCPSVVPTGVIYHEANIEDNLSVSRLGLGQFNAVSLFEVLEHLDQTDECLKIARDLVRSDGRLFVAIPNLASLYGRIELLLGFQPHVLEVSNVNGTLGMGKFGKLNYGDSTTPLHHIRGITMRGAKELVEANGFKILNVWGFNTAIPYWPKSRLQGLASSIVIESVPT
jgi:hypothetical protein